MVNAYIYLTVAIITEVIATSALKATEEFTKPIPSIVVVIGYVTSFYFLTLTLRDLPIGITYAVWSGVGILLITLMGKYFYQQTPDLPAIIGMLFIVTGVIIIHLFSKSTGH